jgi:hypothetical protein
MMPPCKLCLKTCKGIAVAKIGEKGHVCSKCWDEILKAEKERKGLLGKK